jgi:predicted transposase/invertase (TIGR01784 family)
LDIKAVGQDKQLFDIEMQVSGDRHFVNRSLYYWAQLYSRQIGACRTYSRAARFSAMLAVFRQKTSSSVGPYR